MECENPRCISNRLTVSRNKPGIVSKSGIVPPMAPQRIALLPTFLPNTASPTAPPSTI